MTAPGIKAPLVGLDLDMIVVYSQSRTAEAGLGGDSSLSGDGEGLRYMGECFLILDLFISTPSSCAENIAVAKSR